MMSRLVIVLFVSLKIAPTFSVNKESSPNSSNAFDQSIFFFLKETFEFMPIGWCMHTRAHTHSKCNTFGNILYVSLSNGNISDGNIGFH